VREKEKARAHRQCELVSIQEREGELQEFLRNEVRSALPLDKTKEISFALGQK